MQLKYKRISECFDFLHPKYLFLTVFVILSNAGARRGLHKMSYALPYALVIKKSKSGRCRYKTCKSEFSI